MQCQRFDTPVLNNIHIELSKITHLAGLIRVVHSSDEPAVFHGQVLTLSCIKPYVVIILHQYCSYMFVKLHIIFLNVKIWLNYILIILSGLRVATAQIFLNIHIFGLVIDSVGGLLLYITDIKERHQFHCMHIPLIRQLNPVAYLRFRKEGPNFLLASSAYTKEGQTVFQFSFNVKKNFGQRGPWPNAPLNTPLA